MRPPLRDPVFRRLALAYSVNELGNWLGDVALAVVVFDRTRSPLATAALFLAARFVPAGLAPLVVARVEARVPAGARRVLAGLYVAEAATFAALAALVAASAPVWAVVALAAVDGALALAARSLLRAATAARFPDAGDLRPANGALNLGMTLAGAAGPAAAGALVAGAGAAGALALDAGSFAAVALLLPTGLVLAGRQADGTLARLRAAASYVRRHPALGRLLGGQALALVFLTAVLPVEVVFAKATLHAGDAGYGALLASWGVGMVAGAALFARAHRVPLARLLVAGTLAVGAAYGLTAGAPTLAAACAAAALGGVGNGVQWVAFVTALQTATAPALQARVVSLMEAVAAAAPGAGFALGGVLAAAASPRTAFAVAGAGVALAAAAFALATRRAPGAAPAPGATAAA